MDVNWLGTSCRACRRMISLQAAGPLPEEQAHALEAHVRLCPACREHQAQVSAAVAALQAWTAEPAPVQPRAELRQRWTRAVRAESRERASAGLGWVQALAAGWRPFLVDHRLRLATAAVAWAAALFLYLSAPAVPAPARTSAAHSPREVWLALKAVKHGAFWGLLVSESSSRAAEPAQSLRPRSQAPNNFGMSA